MFFSSFFNLDKFLLFIASKSIYIFFPKFELFNIKSRSKKAIFSEALIKLNLKKIK